MAFFQDNFNGLTVLVDIEFVAKFETSVASSEDALHWPVLVSVGTNPKIPNSEHLELRKIELRTFRTLGPIS